MAITKKEGTTTYWLDAEGDWIPIKRVHDHERRRDALVAELVDTAMDMQRVLSQMHETVESKVGGYLESVAEQYDDNWQGNATLTDFSGRAQVELKVNKRMEFDERLQIARNKINQCVKNWSQGASQNLQALVEKAFKVDKRGGLDVRNIISLKSLKIDDELWQEAMDIIDESLKVSGTKSYYMFRVRNDKGEWETINLNFARA